MTTVQQVLAAETHGTWVDVASTIMKQRTALTEVALFTLAPSLASVPMHSAWRPLTAL